MAKYDVGQGFKGKPGKFESPKAFEAFTAFLQLGRQRTIQKVADFMGVSKSAIVTMSRNYAWKDRAAEYDADQVRATFADVRKEKQEAQKRAIRKFRDEQLRRAEGMGDLADLMMDLTSEKLQAMRAAGELPCEQQISNLAKTVASLADMAMNLQATGLGVDELVDTLETELGE